MRQLTPLVLLVLAAPRVTLLILRQLMALVLLVLAAPRVTLLSLRLLVALVLLVRAAPCWPCANWHRCPCDFSPPAPRTA